MVSAKIGRSGNQAVDNLAHNIWNRRQIHPLHAITSGPPPLAPLSPNVGSNDPGTPTEPLSLPPLVPIGSASKTSPGLPTPSLMPEVIKPIPDSEDPLNTSWAEEVERAEEDLKNDVLSLRVPVLSDDEDDRGDLFDGIIVKDPGVRRKMWTIYPKGRPKVEVRVRDGWVRLRCLGQIKESHL